MWERCFRRAGSFVIGVPRAAIAFTPGWAKKSMQSMVSPNLV